MTRKLTAKTQEIEMTSQEDLISSEAHAVEYNKLPTPGTDPSETVCLSSDKHEPEDAPTGKDDQLTTPETGLTATKTLNDNDEKLSETEDAHTADDPDLTSKGDDKFGTEKVDNEPDYENEAFVDCKGASVIIDEDYNKALEPHDFDKVSRNDIKRGTSGLIYILHGDGVFQGCDDTLVKLIQNNLYNKNVQPVLRRLSQKHVIHLEDSILLFCLNLTRVESDIRAAYKKHKEIIEKSDCDVHLVVFHYEPHNRTDDARYDQAILPCAFTSVIDVSFWCHELHRCDKAVDKLGSYIAEKRKLGEAPVSWNVLGAVLSWVAGYFIGSSTDEEYRSVNRGGKRVLYLSGPGDYQGCDEAFMHQVISSVYNKNQHVMFGKYTDTLPVESGTTIVICCLNITRLENDVQSAIKRISQHVQEKDLALILVMFQHSIEQSSCKPLTNELLDSTISKQFSVVCDVSIFGGELKDYKNALEAVVTEIAGPFDVSYFSQFTSIYQLVTFWSQANSDQVKPRRQIEAGGTQWQTDRSAWAVWRLVTWLLESLSLYRPRPLAITMESKSSAADNESFKSKIKQQESEL